MKNQNMKTADVKTARRNPAKINIKDITLIGMMTAITCIVAPMTIITPFSVVPISLTNLVIYFTVLILGCKKGTISYLIYLLIGLAGVPVFSKYSGGPAVLVGPTGGYIVGFIFLAVICGVFVEKFHGKIYMYAVGMVLGLIVTYALGTAWLAFQTGLTLNAALLAGVIPFLPGDAIKIFVVILVGPTLRKSLSNVIQN